MTSSNFRSHLVRTRVLLAALTCLLGLFACTISGRVGSGGVLQQDWDKRRGPVVPHDTFPQDCSLCHEGGTWTKIRADFVFDHEKETGTPLRGAHAAAECLRCHNDRGAVQQFSQQGCVGCHEDVHRGKQGANCSTCHTESNWKVNDAIALHSKTRFPLFGVHAAVECWRCHEGAQVGNFDRAPVSCESCHQAELATAVNPDHFANGWTTDCAHCHAPVSWAQGDFNHSWYPLVGQHRSPPRACEDCHQNNVWTGLHNQCVDCHLADFQGTTTPDHTAASFAQTCGDCHTPSAWQPSSYVHTATFPLRNGHAVPPNACADCHGGGVFTGTPSTCVSCHLADYQATTQPDHAASNYPTTCSNCHDTTDFHNAVFNHDSWPLTGTHLQVNCTDCHLNNNYTNAPTQCYGCHQTDYDTTSSPAHLSGQFPTSCQDCHTTVHFTPSSFHHTNTFPLTGGHAQPPRTCLDCHSGSYPYTGTPSTCVGCHGASASVDPVYNASSNTLHIQMGGNPLVCTQCHNTNLWQPPTFDHSVYPLTGMHLPPNISACSQCHTNSNYSNVPTTCVGCHQADYAATTTPPHAASSFPTTCQTCHTTAGWTGATFNHSWWPLAGAHTVPPRQCTDCHGSGVYQGTPTTCVSCHLANYQGTTNPNHVTSNFPQTCGDCHSTTDWTGATFDHSSWWPLTGQHAVPPRVCLDCHTSGTYGQMPTTCVSCHLADYQGTTIPPHQSNNFPQTCQTCHNTSAWQPSTFSHTNVGFNLTGAHTTTACALCHVNGQYNGGTPTTCSGCHGATATIDPVYSTTNAPPHSSSPTVFTQTCQTCHNTSAWTGATFPHNNVGFALNGSHVSPPLACTACHTGTGSGWHITQFACVNCHLSDFQGTTAPPHVANGFPQTCNTCHNTTHWQPGTFTHTNVGFNLTGAHTSVACTACHVNNNYSGNLPTACSGCHMPDFNATTNPDHEVQGYPMTCTGSGTFTCHNTNNWTSNGFNPATTHDNTFRLPHHNSRCNQCHTTTQVFTAFSCISGGCHGQSNTNGHHNGVNGYQYNSNACYNCHPNGQALTGGILQRPASPTAVRPAHIRPSRRSPPRRIPGPTRERPVGSPTQPGPMRP
ncbi:MAG: hypothetical protein IPJ19_17185 [Planctomycetes bacterium]|nr:hypothetical protein [Planctomycetota bacterium]